MKKTIFKRLTAIIFVSGILILGLNYLLQIESAQSYMEVNSRIKLNQIEQILEQNTVDIQRIQEELGEDYIIRAKAAAYIMQRHPQYEDDLEEMKKIANLLQVDEFHLFDKKGMIYSGSEPKYYGLDMNSGEQISFFKPMLEDTSLELVQEVTPNTAEGKMMQYVAVWREDGEGIVQIGMEPDRLLEAMEKNELSYIFSKVTSEANTIIYAINKEDGTILGCTQDKWIGQDADQIGLRMPEAVSAEKGFFLDINGRENYCVFQEVGNQYIGISQEKSEMYKEVQRSTLLLAVYLVIVFVIMLLAILMQVDKLIIRGIQRVNHTLSIITKGNLDVVVEESSTKEFAVLSNNINTMVSSLLDATNSLSQLFESVNVEMGVYEYHGHMKRVLATRKTASLLALSDKEQKEALADKAVFEARLNEIKKYPVEGTEDIFCIPGEEKRYIKIRSFVNGRTTLGVIVDETADVLEKHRIEYERDSDMLTGLYSRRAFFKKAEKLFTKPEVLKNAVIIMADVDYLKKANDTYGHAFGDQLIAAAAELFKDSNISNSLGVRLSGDEFALLLYGAETKTELEHEIQRIYNEMLHKTIKNPEGEDYPVRLSAGYVFYSQQVQSFDELMLFADEAMYQVKRKNKASFMEYSKAVEKQNK